MSSDWSLDLAIAPEGATARISANINKRGKRAFGVLKTANEYVGVVADREFEVWERQKRAVHARGRVVARSRGSRVDVRFTVPRRTRFLIGLFSTQPPDPSVSAGEVLVSIVGAGVLVALFITGARSQRADLEGFFNRIFEGVARL